MTETIPLESPKTVGNDWKKIVLKYQQASVGRATWQIVNTLVPFIAAWVGMYFAVKVSWLLVLPCTLLAAGLLVRLFIIFHDCTHGSFFKSETANNVLGYITGVLTWTPYYHWRWEHTIHHATSGNLDKRGFGDIWTLTVQEYLEASALKKVAYRLSRNPFVLFLLGPLFLFIFWNRFARPSAPWRERLSVWTTNLGIAVMVFGLGTFLGWKNYVLMQLLVTGIGAGLGVWMFYVQHQFEGAYWDRQGEWDYASAALQGSSFYKLPKILQWFSGNIGFHHIHHLSPRIPNYNLERCHKSEPIFNTIKPLTLLQSLKCVNFRFWDEERRELVGCKRMREIRRQQRTQTHSQAA